MSNILKQDSQHLLKKMIISTLAQAYFTIDTTHWLNNKYIHLNKQAISYRGSIEEIIEDK